MLSRANFAPVPPVYNGNACASQVPCYRSLPSPHLHRMNSVGSSHVLLPESLQSKHEILQVKPMPGMATDTVFPTTTVSSSHLTCISPAASANSKANDLARFAVRLTSRTIALHRPRAGVSLGHYRMCDTEVEEPRCAKQSRERK